MKLLHTSDWHLGHNLMNQDRKREHQQFLDWLIKQIQNEQIDVLVVAGDIFDTCTPPNYALELYYNFLKNVSQTCCNNIIIVGGNHDSISTLNAPKELLKLFNIHVVGGVSQNSEDHIIKIKDENGSLIGLVCAIPYLRDRDVRTPKAGESFDDKSKAYVQGIKQFYQSIYKTALNIKNHDTNESAPIISTGHFFLTGSLKSEGERDLYVGHLGEISIDHLPLDFDYFALGHLHSPQKVKDYESIRYSGSPIPLSFSELNRTKEVVLVEFEKSIPVIKSIKVPQFQEMKVIKGNLSHIENELVNCKLFDIGEKIWVEIQIENETKQTQFTDIIMDMIKDRPIEVLAIKYIENKVKEDSLQFRGNNETNFFTLNKPFEIFTSYLSLDNNVLENEKTDLMNSFYEIFAQVQSEVGAKSIED